MKTVVLVSGGMDSVVALHDAVHTQEVAAGLSFDYGSKHNHREIPFAEFHCRILGIPHRTISLQFIADCFESHLLKRGGEIPEGHYENENMKQTVVPFRNGIMLAIAAGFAECQRAEAVTIAAHSGDHAIYPDCRKEFMEPMAEAISSGTYAGIKLLRPFLMLRKDGVAARGAKLGVDFSKTWSCYKGGERHCGKCGTCFERKEAFFLSGLLDPTEYVE